MMKMMLRALSALIAFAAERNARPWAAKLARIGASVLAQIIYIRWRRRGLLLRAYDWFALTAWRSWLAHLGVCLVIAGTLSAVGSHFGFSGGWLLGSTVGAALYITKEIAEGLRYRKQGSLWSLPTFDGVVKFVDGVGDVIGPVALALGSWAQYLLG